MQQVQDMLGFKIDTPSDEELAAKFKAEEARGKEIKKILDEKMEIINSLYEKENN